MEEGWKFLAGGAAVGLIAGAWSRIKDLLWRIMNLFLQQVEITSEHAHNALVGYLLKKFPRSRFHDRMYGAWYEHQRDGKYGLIPCEVFGARTILFWQGLFPFWFSNPAERRALKSGNQGEGAGNEAAGTKVYSTLLFLRGTLDVEALVQEACQASNQVAWAVEKQTSSKNRFVIHYVPRREEKNDEWGQSSNGLPWYRQGSYRLLSHSPDQLGKGLLHAGNALGNLIFPPRIKSLIQEIELWRSSRDWYREKGLPWKRGWLLFGPPGTGKTALARAFAEDLNMPIYVFNLAEMTNAELMKTWSDMQINVPCIALIEDIDNVFHGRQNVARPGGMMPMIVPQAKKEGDESTRNPFAPLTFDCLLNCLDGVERSDGIFTIVTTNDIAKVDPALGQPRKLPDGTVEFISTRPGRIDKAVELSYLENPDKKQMAQRILGEYPAELTKMIGFIDQFPDLKETPAQFQERCGQIALACFWRNKATESAVSRVNPPEKKPPFPRLGPPGEALNSPLVEQEMLKGKMPPIPGHAFPVGAEAKSTQGD